MQSVSKELAFRPLSPRHPTRPRSSPLSCNVKSRIRAGFNDEDVWECHAAFDKSQGLSPYSLEVVHNIKWDRLLIRACAAKPVAADWRTPMRFILLQAAHEMSTALTQMPAFTALPLTPVEPLTNRRLRFFVDGRASGASACNLGIVRLQLPLARLRAAQGKVLVAPTPRRQQTRSPIHRLCVTQLPRHAYLNANRPGRPARRQELIGSSCSASNPGLRLQCFAGSLDVPHGPFCFPCAGPAW